MSEIMETKKEEANQLFRYNLFYPKRSCDFWKVLLEFTNNVVKKLQAKQIFWNI